MYPLIKHLLLPAIMPTSLVVLYCTPLTVMSCRNRGYLALAIAFGSMIAALVIAARGLLRMQRGGQESPFGIISIVLLILSTILLLGPLG